MTYNAPKARTFREKKGDLDTKITNELILIDAEIDTVKSTASSLASTVSGHTTTIGGHTTSIGTLTTAVGTCIKMASAALASGNADAFALAWPNPITGSILLVKLIVNITTPGGTATSELNFGTAANGTTGSDNLIDGLDANAAALSDNQTGAGTNGKSSAILTEGQYITGQIKTANAAALAGTAYILYVPL